MLGRDCAPSVPSISRVCRLVSICASSSTRCCRLCAVAPMPSANGLQVPRQQQAHRFSSNDGFVAAVEGREVTVPPTIGASAGSFLEEARVRGLEEAMAYRPALPAVDGLPGTGEVTSRPAASRPAQIARAHTPRA